MDQSKDQSSYKIAEYILFNREALRYLLANTYFKARSLSREMAMQMVEDRLAYKLAELGAFDLEAIDSAFADEKVRIIIDKYYLMDFNYEH